MTPTIKYKNQVCIYNGRYTTFNVLKRLCIENPRSYLLPKEKQSTPCNLFPYYKNIPYWQACYILRKEFGIEYPYDYMECVFQENWRVGYTILGHRRRIYRGSNEDVITVAASRDTLIWKETERNVMEYRKRRDKELNIQFLESLKLNECNIE